MPYPFDTQEDYDDWCNDLVKNCPEAWEASDGAQEYIITRYIHTLENRLIALGGTLLLEEYAPEDHPKTLITSTVINLPIFLEETQYRG